MAAAVHLAAASAALYLQLRRLQHFSQYMLSANLQGWPVGMLKAPWHALQILLECLYKCSRYTLAHVACLKRATLVLVLHVAAYGLPKKTQQPDSKKLRTGQASDEQI
jgi:hypothetical protein